MLQSMRGMPFGVPVPWWLYCFSGQLPAFVLFVIACFSCRHYYYLILPVLLLFDIAVDAMLFSLFDCCSPAPVWLLFTRTCCEAARQGEGDKPWWLIHVGCYMTTSMTSARLYSCMVATWLVHNCINRAWLHDSPHDCMNTTYGVSVVP